ncbi:MAG: carbamoyltransferase HypF [Acidobacteriota bacterium]
MYRLARISNLSGFVRNDSEGVWIELEGKAEAVSDFPGLLRRESPPLAQIDGIEIAELDPIGETEFRVVASAHEPSAGAVIPADSATCAQCLRELFDTQDRRYRYPFINCTDCGPRYTIVRDVPYDRGRTTMDAFRQCPPCLAEYENPGDRRFHAEPNACSACGPSLELREAGVPPRREEEALAEAVRQLSAGRIVAIKGLGGFLLAVDACNEEAVARLRQRKRRPHKPFAVMARELDSVARIADVGEEARWWLESPARPIVLLPARPESPVAPSVAPGLAEIGVMLPATPLHHLLFRDGPPWMVMTSGNRAEEPIAKDNDAALERMAGIADAFLLHDRGIHTRADDSVVRIVAGGAVPIRRARGYVPRSIRLPFDSAPVLAVGAEKKNTVCMTRGDQAYLSPHVGDLQNVEASSLFEEVIQKFSRLLAVDPEAVAHDWHPDYVSTRWALRSALPRVPVQHHHAHIASCAAEHGRTAPVLGVAFDGNGCGPAGDLWGGEFLLSDLSGFRRLGHLRSIALPGGEAAIREPWRLALAALLDAGIPHDGLERISGVKRDLVRRMIEARISTTPSTGAGRWFDAVSALCGVRDEISYEGQAAIELEAAATEEDPGGHAFAITASPDGPFQVDLRPMVREIAAEVKHGRPVPEVASRFHSTLAAVITGACQRGREQTGVETVALSGGCFQNRLLTERAKRLLEREGFEVLVHRLVPPNDGGVALGQAAVAAFRMREERGD